MSNALRAQALARASDEAADRGDGAGAARLAEKAAEATDAAVADPQPWPGSPGWNPDPGWDAPAGWTPPLGWDPPAGWTPPAGWDGPDGVNGPNGWTPDVDTDPDPYIRHAVKEAANGNPDWSPYDRKEDEA